MYVCIHIYTHIHGVIINYHAASSSTSAQASKPVGGHIEDKTSDLCMSSRAVTSPR